MSINNDDRLPLSWKTRWVMRRNSMLGSARFQQFAARTPLFRSIARRRAAAQFDLVAGFVYSQILAAFVQAGLIGFLDDELRTVAEIADFSGLGTDAMERLLLAGASLDLAESPQAGMWTLGSAGAELSANEGAMAMIRHHHLLYRDLADPLRLLAGDRRDETALSAYWTYASKDPGRDSADYSALMAATQPMVAAQIVRGYDFSAHKRMLDIGGGSGAFVGAVSKVSPALQFGIFDLPDVAAALKETHAGVGLHPGNFRTDPLPPGYDLITLIRILHDHDDDIAQALLKKIHAALPDRGKLLIVEPMSESAGAGRMGHAYFGLYLWAMNSGRPRSSSEIAAMLAKAGFSKIAPVKTALPLIASALVATK